MRLILAPGLACLLLFSAQPAWASLHSYPEAEGQMMYRSLQSLRDNQDSAWQVTLFKRVNHGETRSLLLRLVGFPGQVEVAHPQPLQIQERLNKTWQLEDASDRDPQLTPNVGQYDLKAFIAQLDGNPPLQLQIPLRDGTTRTLIAPPFITREWQKLEDL